MRSPLTSTSSATLGRWPVSPRSCEEEPPHHLERPTSARNGEHSREGHTVETHLSLRQQQQRDRAVIILQLADEPGPLRGPHPPLFAPVWPDDAAVLAPAERRPAKARRRRWPHHLRHVVGIQRSLVASRRRLIETALARPREPRSAARPPPRSRPLHVRGSYRSLSQPWAASPNTTPRVSPGGDVATWAHAPPRPEK